MDSDTGSSSSFAPLLINALYTGLSRGLNADIRATQAVGGLPLSLCTAHIVASHGVVTDVLNVPSDTVHAQIEHVLSPDTPEHITPNAVKVGIVGATPSVRAVAQLLENEAFSGPSILDVTLSGPSGEDIAEPATIESLTNIMGQMSLVTVRRRDAELLASMEIPTLDDAQVAVQRIGQQGASSVLLRCGRLPTHFFEREGEPPNFALDLLWHEGEMALFEAPFVETNTDISGRSSAYLVDLLHRLHQGTSLTDAIQASKRRLADTLHSVRSVAAPHASARFFAAFESHKETPMHE
ncbi:MAG: bifunctional hydroxymethylpyrimidine kinase/phosphomethylpyrimidine kinase [Longimonas sp.]|uniref:bifunctional hydroxymethylpyrimidine kinase/phosphomethylpyrimidine kinase n=1 Tax=Longimonas sp. TaxID=2039626 RepID=UPI003974EB87